MHHFHRQKQFYSELGISHNTRLGRCKFCTHVSVVACCTPSEYAYISTRHGIVVCVIPSRSVSEGLCRVCSCAEMVDVGSEISHFLNVEQDR
jgi:hypothetical protein